MRKSSAAWREAQGEDLFRTLAETTSAAILIVENNKIRYANPAATIITGYSLDQLTQMDFDQLIHPAYRLPVANNGITNRWSSDIPIRYEMKWITQRGEERWVDLTAAKIKYQTGEAVMMTAFDITARDLAEQELRKAKQDLEIRVQERTDELLQSNQQLQAVLRALPVAVFIADASGRIIEKNQLAEEVWGGSVPMVQQIEDYAQFQGWNEAGESLKPEDWALARAIRRGATTLAEILHIQRFDGSEGTILNSAAPTTDQFGHITGAIAIMQDITHQSELEQELRRVAYQANRQSEKLNAIFRTLTDPLIAYDEQGNVLRANPAINKLYGFDATGKNLSELYPYLEVRKPDGQVLTEEEWPSSRALRGESIDQESLSIAMQSGEECQMIISAAPLYVDGQFRGAVVHMHDVTSQEKLLHENIQRAEELDAIIQGMADAVIIYNAQGEPVLANQVVRESFGFDPTKVSKKETIRRLKFTDPEGNAIPPDQLPSARALKGEPIKNERYMYFNVEEKQVTMMISVSPLHSDGQITGAVAVWHDVTEREQLLNQLQAERARLSTVIANAPESIMVADEQGRIILANPAAERLYGQMIPYGEPYSAREKQNIHYPDGTPYDPRDLPLTRSALDGETLTNVEALVIRPDRTQVHLLINSAPIFDRNGNPAGAIAVSQDIGARKQIEEQIRKNAARAEVLSSLSQAFAEAGLYYAAVLSTITHEITEKIGDGSLVRLLSDDQKWLDVVAVHHPDNTALSMLRKVLRTRRLSVDEGLSGKVFHTRRPIIIQNPNDYAEPEILQQEFSDWLKKTDTHSLLVIPLQAQGSLIGTLTVMRPSGSEPYSADDQIFFMSLADRAALAIENAMLFADEARRARELDALHSATSALLGTLDLNALLSQILDAAQSAIPAAERGTLHLVEPETGKLEIRATLNNKDSRIAHIAHPNGTDYPSVVVRSRKPLLVHDTLNNPTGAVDSQDKASAGFRSLVIAPLIISDEVIGTLSLTASRPFAFTKEDLRLLMSFAVTTSAAMQNAMLHAKVQTLAITDPLTEQYNRRGFFELAQREMERFSRYHYPLAAIMLDIDHFKDVNDTHGHRVGDRVLRSLADRIDQNIRQVDILGRYGGEEFVVLLPETELFKACEIAERIRSAVESEPVLVTDNGPIHVSISAGVTKATHETTSLSELLEHADKALYLAKQNGRNRVEIS